MKKAPKFVESKAIGTIRVGRWEGFKLYAIIFDSGAVFVGMGGWQSQNFATEYIGEFVDVKPI